jgi:hypothetical protein
MCSTAHACAVRSWAARQRLRAGSGSSCTTTRKAIIGPRASASRRPAPPTGKRLPTMRRGRSRRPRARRRAQGHGIGVYPVEARFFVRRKLLYVTLGLGGGTHTCSAEGQRIIVSGWKGYALCPDPAVLCSADAQFSLPEGPAAAETGNAPPSSPRSAAPLPAATAGPPASSPPLRSALPQPLRTGQPYSAPAGAAAFSAAPRLPDPGVRITNTGANRSSPWHPWAALAAALAVVAAWR